MVARIIPSNSLRGTLMYNERKVEQKIARCIHAANYPKDLQELSVTNKLNMLKKLAELNPRVKKNSIHISLNFDPSEKLTREQYQQIAERYMQGIGYGQQPYLVYEHLDSGHPHLHIVTTNVQANGERIESHNIGRVKSESIRKTIEKEFGLVEAERQRQNLTHELQPINTTKLVYGKGETKKEIQERLAVLLPKYKYSSLTALNALLRQYNIMADKGTENSRIQKHQGLVYRILNEQGKPVGVGIKASSFYMKPTLHALEKIFAENKAITNKKERRIRNAIDLALQGNKIKSLAQFKSELKGNSIDVHLWKNDKNQVYGITYIDHESKWVLNGSDLGKGYSAKAIQDRLHQPATIRLEQVPKQEQQYEQHFFVMPLQDWFLNTMNEFNRIFLSGQNEEGIMQQTPQHKKRKKKKFQLRH